MGQLYQLYSNIQLNMLNLADETDEVSLAALYVSGSLCCKTIYVMETYTLYKKVIELDEIDVKVPQ